MTVKVMVSFPEEFLEQVDQVAREEHRSRSELLREALRLYMEMRRGQRRPGDDPRVQAAVAAQDALARLAPGAGEDSTADVRRWRSTSVPHRDLLDEIVQRVFQVVHPQRILLFGSAARGQLKPDSDLDLLVIVREPVHRRALAQEIYRNLHGIPLPVDIVVATEGDVERYGDRVGTILRPALREGQVIYEA